jgi:hypothetical protein
MIVPWDGRRLKAREVFQRLMKQEAERRNHSRQSVPEALRTVPAIQDTLDALCAPSPRMLNAPCVRILGTSGSGTTFEALSQNSRIMVSSVNGLRDGLTFGLGCRLWAQLFVDVSAEGFEEITAFRFANKVETQVV